MSISTVAVEGMALVAGLRCGRGEAVDVQRGFVQQFEQDVFPSPSVWPRANSFAQHSSLLGASARPASPIGAERRDAVIEVRDQHVAALVFHAGEQLRQHHRRVGSPVAVVAAVQSAVGAVDGDREVGDAARAEDDRLPAALVDRAVADEPDVAARGRRL